MGHSMGGHGALTIALKDPGTYSSVSAFSPICNPTQCPWGQKAFSRYLGVCVCVCIDCVNTHSHTHMLEIVDVLQCVVLQWALTQHTATHCNTSRISSMCVCVRADCVAMGSHSIHTMRVSVCVACVCVCKRALQKRLYSEPYKRDYILWIPWCVCVCLLRVYV